MTGRLRTGGLGAVLPFCECGAFPIMLGLLRAGVPTGVVQTLRNDPYGWSPASLLLVAEAASQREAFQKYV